MENSSQQMEKTAKHSKTLQEELKEVFQKHGIEIGHVEYESIGNGQAVWTLAGEGFQGPSAYVFENGNVLFFDKQGNQIPALQEKGEQGLERFLERYPQGNLYICSDGEKHKAENPEEYIPPK